MAKPRLGWILIHSHSVYPADGYETPQDQLRAEFKSGLRWHWATSKPITEGGPYTLLFAWKGKIFGEGSGHVTHVVESRDYNFAFVLNEYHETQGIALDKLPVPRPRGGLLKLDRQILSAYRKLAK